MSEQLRAKAGLVYNVVESVILLVAVGMTTWTAHTVITQGNTLSSHSNQIGVNTGRLDKIEGAGSAGLQAHVREDDRRVLDIDKRLEKLEQAVIALQSAPGELKAMNARLESLGQSQVRIERALDEHMKERSK